MFLSKILVSQFLIRHTQQHSALELGGHQAWHW